MEKYSIHKRTPLLIHASKKESEPMAIIRPETNKPLTVNLLYPSAKEKPGRGGIDFMYTLQGGDALFVPPIAHAEIQALHAGPGEPFTLLKTIGQGNQAQWKVERIVVPSAPQKGIKTERSEVQLGATVTQKPITNGKSPVAVMSVPAHDSTLSTPQSKTLLRQLIAAIEVTHAAKIYAQKLGMNIEFTGTDIRALAITGGIQVFKEGVY